MTGLTLPRSRTERPGRHVDASSAGAWLTQRLNPSAFVQTMLIICLILMLWPAQFGGKFAVTIVAGNSMEPTYNLGDAVITWKEPVQVGDTVLFVVPEGEFGAGNPVIHRVIEGDSSGWVTQGDNSHGPDMWSIRSSDVLGVAQFRIPVGGRVVAIMKSWLLIAALGGLAVALLFWPAEEEDEEAMPAKATRRRRGRHKASRL